MQNAPVTYYALDLEKRELERTLSELSNSELGAELDGKITTKGLCATYDDGLAFIQDGGLQAQDEGPPEFRDHYHVARIGAARDASPSSSHSGDTDVTPPSTPGGQPPSAPGGQAPSAPGGQPPSAPGGQPGERRDPEPPSGS